MPVPETDARLEAEECVVIVRVLCQKDGTTQSWRARVTAGPTCKLRGKGEGTGNTGQPGINQVDSKAKMILLRLEGETTVEDAVRAFGYLKRPLLECLVISHS